jgi:hypothetical protein
MIAMTSQERVLFYFAWVAAVPTLLFAAVWIGSMLFGRSQRRAWIDEGEAGDEDCAPSVAEADAMLRDHLSPDCSPLNARRRQ